MRTICSVTGVLIAVTGAVAVVTGEFVVHAGWLFATGLAVVGLAGLLTTTAALSR